MMSMDAIVNAGFTIANFTDTSGNPSASKVYRASRIILAQPNSRTIHREHFAPGYGQRLHTIFPVP